MLARAGRQFTDALKDESVHRARSSGKTIAQVARALDLAGSASLNWVERARSQSGAVSDLPIAERQKLLQLRQENRVLRMERER